MDDKKLKERLRRERSAHTERDVLAESYRLKARFKHIWSYPSRRRMQELVEAYLGGISGQLILDYGCGRGQASLGYLRQGATVLGIDVSPVYVGEAMFRAHEAGVSSERYQFHVMDAHALAFPNDVFHLAIGNGILHHLDADLALRELCRVLRPNGRVLLKEPLADNPLLKLFRALTPTARTDDEAPLSGGDVARIIQSKLWKTELSYCGVVEAPVAVLSSLLVPDRPNNVLLRLADRLERLMHERGILLSCNQYVLLNLVKRPG